MSSTYLIYFGESQNPSSLSELLHGHSVGNYQIEREIRCWSGSGIRSGSWCFRQLIGIAVCRSRFPAPGRRHQPLAHVNLERCCSNRRSSDDTIPKLRRRALLLSALTQLGRVNADKSCYRPIVGGRSFKPVLFFCSEFRPRG